jgi:hypothetical protein
MKRFIVLLFVFTMLSCSKKEKPQNIDWLQGKWLRINDKPNQQTYEFWNKNRGLGFTMQGNDTVFKEELIILNRHNRLYLEVTGTKGPSVLFKFASKTDSSFICKNKDNEFPKKIYYFLQNDTLKAVVSNEDITVDFAFVKQKN